MADPATHVFEFTPSGGSLIDLNDRVNTFLRKGFKLGSRKKAFGEARSYTGAIRQKNVHSPLVKMSMPIFVHGTASEETSAAQDLKDRVVEIQDACGIGGIVEFQAPDEDEPTYFTIGVGDAPDPEHDYLYIRDHIAKLDLELWRLP